ncbi:MAG: hypothetical protein AAF242_05795, partial [Bacteroidota bacterium]
TKEAIKEAIRQGIKQGIYPQFLKRIQFTQTQYLKHTASGDSMSMELPAFLERISWYQVIAPAMNQFRKRRLSALVNAYPDLSTYRVLDVGGRPDIWKLLKKHYGIVPKELVLLNVSEDLDNFSDEGAVPDTTDPEQIEYSAVAGDGRSLPFPRNNRFSF